MRDNSYAVILLDVMLFLSIFAFAERPVVLLAVLLLISLFLIRNKNDWRVYSATVVAAIIVEPAAVYLGAWQYPHPDFFSVPSWIFVMWGVLAVSLYKLSLNLLTG